MEGTVEKAVVQFIIRDFDTSMLKLHEKRLEQFAKQATGRYDGSTYEFESREQYRNMKDVLRDYPQIGEYVKEAMKRSDVDFRQDSARGGTDGSRLSFMGLPCPNIFAGGHNFHGKYEYVPAESIQKATDVIVKIAELTAIPGAFDKIESSKKKSN
jgi:tripeptide aminopeptidase